ncbi:MAG: hypothetical protein ACD_75C00157G0002 [uncultured bacterium]|nr:MAG: hypothetical protein ACD_75C00157G0002 [uncultured bacterium]
MANILIIDDDLQLCEMLRGYLDFHGHTASYALSLQDGQRQLEQSKFAVVFLNIQLPDGNGLSLLLQLRETAAERPEVIIVTTQFDPEGARMAIENGAWDYLEKPFSINVINPILEGALTYRNQKGSASSLRTLLLRGSVIGSSAPMEDCLELAGRAAKCDVNVMICGETGTGKEVLARVIHQNSRRAEGRLVIVDCAALTEGLAESVLFGYKKGTFTGADSDREGLVQQADRGTLFLDEIGELPLSLQKTFLRVLQEKCFRPLGGKNEIVSDFRLIVATNRNLAEMVGDGHFREDLLFRIQSLVITPPPLRERKQDITELALYHIDRQCKLNQREPNRVSPEFLEVLLAYSWPGNVRELFNTLDSCMATAQGDNILFPKHLPVHMRVEAAQSTIRRRQTSTQLADFNPTPLDLLPIPLDSLPDLKTHRGLIAREAEKDYLKTLLNMKDLDVNEACRIAGLSRSRFYELLRRHKLLIPAAMIIPPEKKEYERFDLQAPMDDTGQRLIEDFEKIF